MESKKSKILVLSDLKKSASTTLESSLILAHMINADINIFYVKKPTDVVESESQLSAFRTINEQHSVTKKAIENLIDSVPKADGVKIDYNYKFGNVKNELEDYIAKYNPDIVVLGKRITSPMKFIGDSITDFVLKTHRGFIMIAGAANTLVPNQELSLGLLNNYGAGMDSDLEKSILANSEKPLKTFSFVKYSNAEEKVEPKADSNTVDYVFERNDNTINNLSNYLSRRNVNMVYINRANTTKDGLATSEIREVINKLNIPLILSGE